MKLQNRPDGV